MLLNRRLGFLELKLQRMADTHKILQSVVISFELPICCLDAILDLAFLLADLLKAERTARARPLPAAAGL